MKFQYLYGSKSGGTDIRHGVNKSYNAEMLFFEGAGHWVHIDKELDFLKNIEKYMKNMNIRRLTNEDFNGAKAFYTGFDDFTTKRKRDKSIVKKSIERDLKVLLLTKNTVVCGASQIVNREAFDILYSNPIILQEKLIIPALREDKNHVIELY